MTMGDTDDPKGLIRESFRIEGIGRSECRSIFLDWALSLPDSAGLDPQQACEGMLARYGDDNADHPMTAVLIEGLKRATVRGRRGGWKGRRRGGSD